MANLRNCFGSIGVYDNSLNEFAKKKSKTSLKWTSILHSRRPNNADNEELVN